MGIMSYYKYSNTRNQQMKFYALYNRATGSFKLCQVQEVLLMLYFTRTIEIISIYVFILSHILPSFLLLLRRELKSRQ